MRTRANLEKRVVAKKLALRTDKPSLQLAPNEQGIQELETNTTYTFGPWEQHIINHLISCCDAGGLEPVESSSSSDAEDEYEEDAYEEDASDEDEPVLKTKSTKEKRGRKQKKKQGASAGNILLQCCNSIMAD